MTAVANEVPETLLAQAWRAFKRSDFAAAMDLAARRVADPRHSEGKGAQHAAEDGQACGSSRGAGVETRAGKELATDEGQEHAAAKVLPGAGGKGFQASGEEGGRVGRVG